MTYNILNKAAGGVNVSAAPAGERECLLTPPRPRPDNLNIVHKYERVAGPDTRRRDP